MTWKCGLDGVQFVLTMKWTVLYWIVVIYTAAQDVPKDYKGVFHLSGQTFESCKNFQSIINLLQEKLDFEV